MLDPPANPYTLYCMPLHHRIINLSSSEISVDLSEKGLTNDFVFHKSLLYLSCVCISIHRDFNVSCMIPILDGKTEQVARA